MQQTHLLTIFYKELKELNDKRTTFRIASREIALWVGLLIGIAISAAGVRTLTTFLDPVAINALRESNGNQYNVLNIVDMTITGSMLAGGSEAINKLTKAYNSFMQATTEKAKNK